MAILNRFVTLPAGRLGKWAVLVGWLAALAVFGTLAGRLERVMDNDETNWLPGGAESTRAIELAAREFPAEDTAPLVVAYAREGDITAADREAVNGDRAALTEYAAAGSGGRALLLTVPVDAATPEDGDAVTSLVGQARLKVATDCPPA